MLNSRIPLVFRNCLQALRKFSRRCGSRTVSFAGWKKNLKEISTHKWRGQRWRQSLLIRWGLFSTRRSRRLVQCCRREVPQGDRQRGGGGGAVAAGRGAPAGAGGDAEGAARAAAAQPRLAPAAPSPAAVRGTSLLMSWSMHFCLAAVLDASVLAVHWTGALTIPSWSRVQASSRHVASLMHRV